MGLDFSGDTFETSVALEIEMVEVRYAYAPQFADQEVKIYRLNQEAGPYVWVEISGSTVKDGVICVTSSAGIFFLIRTSTGAWGNRCCSSLVEPWIMNYKPNHPIKIRIKISTFACRMHDNNVQAVPSGYFGSPG